MSISMAILAGLAVSTVCAVPSPVVLSFDNGMKTSGGAEPSVQTNVKLTDGRAGFAAEFVDGSVLTYAPEAGYNPACGTLDVWVRPNWDSQNAFGDRFFWGVESAPGSGDRTVLGFLGKDGNGLVYFGGDGALGGLATPVDWRAGDWHRVTVCWDQAAKARALYVDGALKHYIHSGAGLPSQPKEFYVGSLPCVTRWMGVPDGHEADAAIDDLTLSPTVDMPGFDQVRLAAAEDEKATQRFSQAREKARPAYEAAWERLLQGPTLDSVAEQHVEVTLDELAGLAAPMTQRVSIEARYHPDVVFQHPDMSIALGRANGAYGIGFALGEPFQLPDAYTVTHTLHKGYMPIVESVWETTGCTVNQTAFTILPRDEDVVTGKEVQYLVVRMAVRNTANEPRMVPLLLLAGLMEGTQNTNYAPFLSSASRWVAPPLNARIDGDAVMLGEKAFLTFEGTGLTKAEALLGYATGATDPLLPTLVTNGVRFELDVKPQETRTLDLVVATAPGLYTVDERESMRQTKFDGALARAEAYWEKGLAPGMTFTTPEPRLNDIYRHLALSCLNNLTKNPERPWAEPYQSPVWEGVWPWECAHMVVPLCAIGYHREMEPMLKFFTERQSGIGQYAEPGRRPEGETKSAYGCYTGNFLLRWTSETGSILWAMAEKYRYSRDVEWLKQNRDSILVAWDWIQGERMRTRRFKESGEPVDYHGLLPKGRVHDWEGWHHFFFSDTFTWKGMDTMAAAFREAGLPEADRLTREADEYRECLLQAIKKAQVVDQDTGLPFVPNLVGYAEGERGGLWWADGPSCMFATGLLDARTDERFTTMFAYLQQTWGTLLGLMNRMDEPKELGKKNPFWYVNASERGYFQNFLARGETEKALLIFYSNLAYGLSQDCYQTVERIHVSDANYSPFQPNASGNGRMLDMFKRMVIDEQEPGVLWILRGCPRRWFAAGQSVTVENAPTYYGVMAMRTQAAEDTITIDIDPPNGEPRPELRVVVRHPERLAPKKVTVNGTGVQAEGDVVVLRGASGAQQIVCQY